MGIIATRQQYAIPDDAHFEGGVPYWIDGEPPELRIMSSGPNGVYQVYNGSYPDEIHDEEQELMRVFKENEKNQ